MGRNHFCVMLCCLVVAWCSSGAYARDLQPWTGGPLPAFELKDLSGRTHRLADYRGKVVLVNFWATWCEPCRAEMPSLEKLKEKFASQPLVVLAVNLNEPEELVKKFLSRFPLTFPVLLDHDGKLARTWGVRVLPATFIFGADGRVRYRVIGDLDWTTREVAERVADLLPRQ